MTSVGVDVDFAGFVFYALSAGRVFFMSLSSAGGSRRSLGLRAAPGASSGAWVGYTVTMVFVAYVLHSFC